MTVSFENAILKAMKERNDTLSSIDWTLLRIADSLECLEVAIPAVLGAKQQHDDQ